MRRLALRSALSDKAATGGLVVVENLALSDARTKVMIAALSALGVEGKTIIVVPAPDRAVRQASGNLQNVHVALPNGLSVVELLQASYVIFARDAVQPVTSLLLGEGAGEMAAAEAPAAAPPAAVPAVPAPEAPATPTPRAGAARMPSAAAPAAEMSTAAEPPATPTSATEAPAPDAPPAKGEGDEDA
jgi:large subunit ribosomal protein L4